MNLQYSILWIENDSDWVGSIDDEIKDFLIDMGFDPRITLHAREDADMYNDYDLILMDMALEDAKSGDMLIKEIRNHNIFSDVVFYTGGGVRTIREKANTLGLEGVYFADRQTNFIDKVKTIILTTIKKVQDLNNIRGLVMDEVSQLDKQMEDIIYYYFVEKETDERKKLFHKKITSDIEKSAKRKLENDNCDKKCEHIWRNKDLKDIIPSVAFDTNQKAHTINAILEKEGIDFDLKRDNFYKSYSNDVITMRNNLAHSVSEIKNGVEVLICKKDGKEIEFKSETCAAIRKELCAYRDFLSEVSLKLL
ncbi:MAG: hypothetical protein MJZ76_07820 [Bacteroidales bacterium]|nr:hypothetical protein [Bacteroidales bacterium]